MTRPAPGCPSADCAAGWRCVGFRQRKSACRQSARWPCGRAAIQCSASSSAGERSSSLRARPARSQLRAASPYSVCRRSSRCQFAAPRRADLALFEFSRVVEEDEIEPAQRLGHGVRIDRAADYRRKPLLSDDANSTSRPQMLDEIASGLSTNTIVSAVPIIPSMRFHQSSNA